jgi:hypothetical protein
MERRPRAVLATVFLSALVTMSCITPCIPGARRSATPAPTVAVSSEAAARLEEKTKGLETGEFRIELTQEEITSYVALQLGDALPVEALQIRILPGQFVVEGDMTSPVRTRITLSGSISAVEGRPAIQFEDATIAGMSVPPALLGSLSESLLEVASLDVGLVEFQQIELAAGRVIVAGRPRQP